MTRYGGRHTNKKSMQQREQYDHMRAINRRERELIRDKEDVLLAAVEQEAFICENDFNQPEDSDDVFQ